MKCSTPELAAGRALEAFRTAGNWCSRSSGDDGGGSRAEGVEEPGEEPAAEEEPGKEGGEVPGVEVSREGGETAPQVGGAADVVACSTKPGPLKRWAAGSTDKRKCARKSTPRMGKATSASRKVQVKRRLLN
jgi:hypothetical protein